MSISRDKLRRLERNMPACSACQDKTQTLRAYYPDKGEHPPKPERCEESGRELLIAVRVVYDG
jgi:hypothetical protein